MTARIMQLVVITAAFAGCGACSQDSIDSNPWAGALSWYIAWNSEISTAQECRAEYLDRSEVHFRCSGINVVVIVSPHSSPSGRGCQITFMRPEYSDEVRVEGTPQAEGSQRCQDLSAKLSPRLNIGPWDKGHWDVRLSARVQERAAAYFERSKLKGCLLLFPKVHTGDAFAHVYRVCDRAVAAVYEFRIASGNVADFAHWVYTPERSGLPLGAAARAEDPSWWLDARAAQD